MRWLLLILLLCGFTPVYLQHDSQDKTDEELNNIYAGVQPKQYRVVTSTPNLSEFLDGELVIFSSGAIKLMFRQNQDIYTVGTSCITIRR